MARRKKSSPAEGLIELLAMLPWWVVVALALLSYLLLHQVATKPLTVTAQPGQLSTMVPQRFWKGMASAGQYILPIICLAASGMAAWRRKLPEGLITDVAQGQASDGVDGMSWREFELLVGEGFRLQGYQVVEMGGRGADGGVELVLTWTGKSGGEKFFLQCRQWPAYKVGVDVVRRLYGVIVACGATGKFVVTSGRFTDDAVGFASRRSLTLVDGLKLVGFIR